MDYDVKPKLGFSGAWSFWLLRNRREGHDIFGNDTMTLVPVPVGYG